MTPEIKHVEPSDDKSKSSKISPDLPVKNAANNEPKISNEVSPKQISYPHRYQTREQ